MSLTTETEHVIGIYGLRDLTLFATVLSESRKGRRCEKTTDGGKAWRKERSGREQRKEEAREKRGNDERRTREQVMKEGQETTESINAGVSC